MAGFKDKLTGLFRITPENRLVVMVGGGFIAVGVLGAFGLYMMMSPSNPPTIEAAPVDSGAVQATAGAETSPAYREAQDAANSERYDAAAQSMGGVAMPFTFEDSGDVELAALTDGSGQVTDEALLAALKRLGVDISGSTSDSRRLAESDIYLSATNQLLNDRGTPLLLDGRLAFLGPKGELVSDRGEPILDERGVALYLGQDGGVYDGQGIPAILAGRLSDKDGIIYMANGVSVSRTSSKDQIGRSDIYVSEEGQLVTADGKGILAQGLYVFVDDEGRLLRGDRALLRWENKTVFQTESGALVDDSGQLFQTPGILISYDGTLLDAEGRLEQPIMAYERLGDSDLAVNDENMLVDLQGRPVRHYGHALYRATNDRVILDDGRQMVSRFGAAVSLTSQGAFKTPMGEGIFQSGGVTTLDGVAYSRRGQLLNDPSLIERRGTSDIYLSSDGLLLSSDGVALLNNGYHVFIEEGLTTARGADPLFLADGTPVMDPRKQLPVYLSARGALESESGDMLTQSGILRTGSGILYAVDGRMTADPRSLDRIIDTNEVEAFFSGQEAFRNQEGVVTNIDGEPFYVQSGVQLFMDEAGVLVDDAGREIADFSLETAEGADLSGPYGTLPSLRVVQMGASDIYLSRDGVLVDKFGRAITHEGQDVYVDPKSGLLRVSDEMSVHSREGKRLYLANDGSITISGGKPARSEVLLRSDGVLIGTDGKSLTRNVVRLGESDVYVSPNQRLVNDGGSPLSYKGKGVYRDADSGRLVTTNGRPVLDVDDRPVYITTAGSLERKGGGRTRGNLLADINNSLYNPDGLRLNKGGLLQKVTQNGVYRAENNQLVDSQARPLLIGEVPAFLGDDNMLTGPRGRSLRVEGLEAFLLDDGYLMDRRGQPIRTPAGSDLLLSTMGLTDSQGQVQGELEQMVVVKDGKQGPKTGEIAYEVESEESEEAGGEPIELEKRVRPEALVLTGEQFERLVRRYETVNAGVAEQVAAVMSSSSAAPNSGYLATGYSPPQASQPTQAPGGAIVMPPAPGSVSPMAASQAAAGASAPRSEDMERLKETGDAMYAIILNSLNTDYSTRVVAKVVGVPPKSPLYDARLVGNMELKYDHMVIQFSQVSLADGRTANIEALALDPENVEAGLQGDVDRHLMYRYGGLFFGSLIQGAAAAMAETVTTEEFVTIGGSRFRTEGLDGTELAVRALEPVGAAIAQSFRGNLNRPVTVTLPVGAEVGVALFSPIEVKKTAITLENQSF